MQIQYSISIFKAPCPGEEKVGGQGSGGPGSKRGGGRNHESSSNL